MSAHVHVFLNSLNELGKSDKMPGLQSILLPFPNSFNKFYNTYDIKIIFVITFSV